MRNIEIKIKQCSNHPINENNVYIMLAIENDSEQDFYLSRDALMLDGFKSNKFGITNAKTTSKVSYIGKNVKYIPNDFILKAHSTVSSSELNLAQAYDFGEAKSGDSYKISFKSYTEFCLDVDHNDCFPVTLSGALIVEMEGY